MAENSKIEWCDHTFNPWIGCTKVSPGCANCYAESQDKFRSWTPEGWVWVIDFKVIDVKGDRS